MGPESPPSSLEPGTLIDGRYRIVEVIGQGGMGRVYSAIHEQLGTSLAVKTLLPGSDRSKELRQWFTKEARSLSKLVHENIVRVMDYGRFNNGDPYLVMELLQGQSLQARLDENSGKRMGWGRVKPFLLDICEATRYAHLQGVIHRDLKPANCFICTSALERERIKVLDFGVAKLTDGETTDYGHAIARIGTLGYMAPEQARGQVVDGRADIYAIVAMMYRMLAGCSVYAGVHHGELLAQVMHGVRPNRAQLVERLAISPRLAEIICKNLEVDPDQRLRTVEQLLLELRAVEADEHEASEARAFDPGLCDVGSTCSIGVETTGAASCPLMSGSHSPSSTRQIRRRWLAGAGLLALGSVCGAYVLHVRASVGDVASNTEGQGSESGASAPTRFRASAFDGGVCAAYEEPPPDVGDAPVCADSEANSTIVVSEVAPDNPRTGMNGSRAEVGAKDTPPIRIAAIAPAAAIERGARTVGTVPAARVVPRAQIPRRAPAVWQRLLESEMGLQAGGCRKYLEFGVDRESFEFAASFDRKGTLVELALKHPKLETPAALCLRRRLRELRLPKSKRASPTLVYRVELSR